MKLIALTLNPFAGVSNYTLHFQPGLNVICGPNEVGKSTAIKALLMTFFTSTNLTPAALKNSISNYLPRPLGDTIHTKLEFECVGLKYVLEKYWGATKSTNFILPDGSVMTDADAVQAKVGELLLLNEATYRSILVANQSELKHSIETLKKDQNVQASLSDLLRKGLMQQDGVSGDKLKAMVENKVISYLDNWELEYGHPRGNRNINNPHKKNVGLILSSFYSKEIVENALKHAIEYEIQLDKIVILITSLNTELQEKVNISESFKKAYQDAKVRAKLDAELVKINMLYNKLSTDFAAWPILEKENKDAEKEVPQIDKNINELNDELRNANIRQNAKSLKEQYEAAKKAILERETVEDEFKQLTEVTDVEVNKGRDLNKKQENARIKIEAQKLKLFLVSEEAMVINLRTGTNKIEPINLEASKERIVNADGKLEFELPSLKVKVESANTDISVLENEISVSKQVLKDLLSKFGVSSLDELTLLKERYDEKKGVLKTKLDVERTLLHKKDFKSLEKEYVEIEELPETRSVEVISNKLVELRTRLQELKRIVFETKEKIDLFVNEYGSKQDLQHRLLKELVVKEEKENGFLSLLPLPEGYNDAEKFLRFYEQNEEEKNMVKDRIAEERIKRGNLEARKPEKTVKELQEELIIRESEFIRKIKEAKAYKIVLEKLNEILSSIDTKTYEPLNKKVNEYLNKLTEKRYNRILLNGVHPQSIHNDSKSLDIELLSKGTLDAVALALRLGSADFYLSNDDGFVIMDDPFVDLDLNRQKAAADVIAEFATDKQTIIFTCHSAHAEILKKEYHLLEMQLN